MKNLRIISGISLIIAGIIISSKSFSMTGNVIGGLENQLGSLLGIAFIIGGALICMTGRGEEVKTGGLERLTWEERQARIPLLFHERKGEVYMRDFSGTLVQEGVYDPRSTAMEIIERLKEYKKNKEYEEILQDAFIKDQTILAARKQRDESGEFPLKVGSIAYVSDQFLKDWDPRYEEIKHPLLRLPALDSYVSNEFLNPDAQVYDANDVIKIMKKNIPGIKDLGQHGHDFYFEYRGERMVLNAGRQNQTNRADINRRITTMASRDIRDAHLDVGKDLEPRKVVLKRAIYGGNE